MQQQWDAFWAAKQYEPSPETSWSKRRIIQVLDRHIRSGMVVLDAGCGSGFFSAYFLSKGCRVYSLDYSTRALEMAKRVTGGRSTAYLSRDLLDKALPIEYEKAFDLIFTDGLFEHFPAEEQLRIMQAFIAMKASEGAVITFVPHRYSFWTVVRPLLMAGIKEKPFTLKRLAWLIRRSGQELVEAGGINVLPIRYSAESLGARLGMLVYAVSR